MAPTCSGLVLVVLLCLALASDSVGEVSRESPAGYHGSGSAGVAGAAVGYTAGQYNAADARVSAPFTDTGDLGSETWTASIARLGG
eukprot:COSAG02_NODE_34510_length_483_cov_0.583333_2_plen_85_part_01